MCLNGPRGLKLTEAGVCTMKQSDKKTILVVDYEELNRKILSLILSDAYNILEADNGISAKRELARHVDEISLILLDIVMPEMDGFALLEYLHGFPEYRGIPVILVSAETYEENVLEGIKMGVKDVIAKPFNPGQVLRRVNNLIRLTEKAAYRSVSTAAAPNTALIVDDLGVNRAILGNTLEGEYAILEAANGREALELLRDHRGEIAVVLLDLIMPELDGIEFMQVVERQKLLEGVPVIAITAEESPSRLNQIMELGCCEVIQKPFTPAVVRNRVNYMVELSR